MNSPKLASNCWLARPTPNSGLFKQFAQIQFKILSHFEWCNKPRKQGGLGEMKIPMLADRNHKIARDYGVLKEDAGIAYRFKISHNLI
jgi:hypothetical protein